MTQQAIRPTSKVQLKEGYLYVNGQQRSVRYADALAALIIATEGPCTTAIAELFPHTFMPTNAEAGEPVEPWREYVAAVRLLAIERETGDCGWTSAKLALTWCARAVALVRLNRRIVVNDDIALVLFLADQFKVIDVTPQAEVEYQKLSVQYRQALQDALDPTYGGADQSLDPPPKVGWQGPLVEWPTKVGAEPWGQDVLVCMLEAASDIAVRGPRARLRLNKAILETKVPTELSDLLKHLPSASAEPIFTSLTHTDRDSGNVYEIRAQGTPLVDGALVWTLRPFATARVVHGFERALAHASPFKHTSA